MACALYRFCSALTSLGASSTGGAQAALTALGGPLAWGEQGVYKLRVFN